ncbi:MAG: 4Fe-4S binding protein [Candidatus Hydrothermarchaeota archaeon]
MDIAKAVEIAEGYVKAQGYSTLEAEHAFQYRNGYYKVEFEEEGTGMAAFELLVNPVSGEVSKGMCYYKWNSKYGGYMPPGKVAVSKGGARRIAEEFLKDKGEGMVIGVDTRGKNLSLAEFIGVGYGFYEFHVLADGEFLNMLKVNMYTGEVWSEAFHGKIVRSLVLMPFPKKASGIPYLPYLASGALLLVSFVGAPASGRSMRLDLAKRLLQDPRFRGLLRGFTALAFLLIVVAGLTGVQRANANFATVATWVFWWAAFVLLTLLFGRLWCYLCPLGVVNEEAAKVGLGREYPGRWRHLWVAVALFLGITIADDLLGIGMTPRYTAYLFLAFLSIAVLMGALFRGRSFCSYICPIGAVTRVLSILAPVEVRLECAGNGECTGGLRRGDCPMAISPRPEARGCIYCMECERGCVRKRLSLRWRGFGGALRGKVRMRAEEAFLVLGLLGILTIHLVMKTVPWKDWLTGIVVSWPAGVPWVMALAMFSSILSVVSAYWMISRLSGDKGLEGAYAYLPLVAVLFLIYILGKLNASWGTLGSVFSNPLGHGSIVPMGNYLEYSTLNLVEIALLVPGYWLSLAATRTGDGKARRLSLAFLLLIVAVALAVLAQPVYYTKLGG